MSYDIDYVDDEGDYFVLDKPHKEGGTFVLDGTRDTCLNVTYNYSWYYYHYVDKEKGIRWLYGKRGRECIERLRKAIEPFEDQELYIHNYWLATPGNCIKPLWIFLAWCEKWPNGIFKGD